MARPTSAARRYAEAIFEIASRDGTQDRWATDLALATSVIGDEQVARIVNSPAVPLADRANILGSMLGDRLAWPAINLVKLLDVRGRLTLLPAIAVQYVRLLDRSRGVVAATVTSAAPLDADEMAAVQSRIETMTGRTVRLAPMVDPALMGGLTLRVGDRLIDASVRGRLERLRDQLVAGTR